MKTLHPDLFPETLLVSQREGRAIATSLKVAEHFKKSHKDVMRSIKNVLSDIADDEFSRRNFAPRNQIVRGREYPYCDLSEEAFALTVMGFTGKAAMQWKLDFLKAFISMRERLQAREARFAHALDQVRPMLRPVVEATEQGLPRSAIAEPLGKTPASITYHRGQARRFGLIA